MKQEDYFPQAFCSYGDEEKIYGILLNIDIYTQTINANLLAGNDPIDIDSFLDTLLPLGGTAVYERNFDSGEVLQSLLQGSETLWGMIDWETDTCSLDTPIFAKLLQAAKNLGTASKKNYAPVAEKILFI